MATVTKPIALDESLNTTEVSPRNIADVLAQELEGIAQALTPVQPSASDVSYDNTASGLAADDVQDAIDELADEKANTADLATVATSGSYNDLGDKPTIPTVGNGTLTIQQNGTTVGTFTANQSANATANITTPTGDAKSTTSQFYTANGGVLDKCVVDMEPVQDLHGYSYPWVAGAGKNKLPLSLDVIKSVNTNGSWSGNSYAHNGGVTFTVMTDDDGNIIGVKANGTATANNNFKLKAAAGLAYGNYILNGGLSANKRIYFFDGATWYNATGSDVSFSVTASTTQQEVTIVVANGQTCSNDMFYPMIRLSTETDATFEPYENICPITGHTEVDVERNSKNYLPLPIAEAKSGITLTHLSDGSIKLEGTASAIVYFDFFNGNFDSAYYEGYKFIFSAVGSTSGIMFRVSRADRAQLQNFSVPDTFQPVGNSGDNLYFAIRVDNGTALPTGGLIIKPMLVSPTETDATFEPCQKLSVQIPLGDTYYGGTLDVVSGELVVEYGTLDLGTCNWSPQSPPGRFDSTTTATLKKPGETNIKCSIYRTVTVGEMSYGCIRGSSVNGNIVILDSRFANYTGAQVKTALNGVQLVYELATPVTVQLTPHQITALVGQNNISAPLDGQSITDAVYKELFTWEDVQSLIAEKVPDAPTTDGTYTLKAVVSGGVPTYSWV